MPTRSPFRQVLQITQTVVMRARQVMRRVRQSLRSRIALAAEHRFLQQQFALCQAPNATWRRDMHATHLTLVWLSYWCDWQPALTIVQPATFRRWRRQGLRLLWQATSTPGRPPIPPEFQALIRRRSQEHMTWGQQRIANERLFKLGLRVLPHTVRTYTPQRLHLGPGQCATSQRWRTFVHNHARALIIRGVAADLNRSLQVLAIRLMRFVQRWRGRSVSRTLQDPAPHDPASLSQLRDTASGPGVRSPAIVDVISVDERGPPAMRPSHNHDPVTAARAAYVGTSAWRPVVRALRWGSITSPPAQGIQHLNNGGTRVALLRRVA